MNSKNIGKNIRQHREERHWTQEELAMAADIDVRTIQRAESGQNLALETLRAIANAFEITIDQLSKESQEEALAEFRAKYSVIELHPLEQASDLCQLFGTHAYHFQRIGKFNDDQADLIAELEQSAKDYGEIWSDLEPSQQRDAEKSLQPLIAQLGSLDLAVSVGIQSMKLRSTTGTSQSFAFSVLYVAVVPGCQPLRVLIREKGTHVQFV